MIPLRSHKLVGLLDTCAVAATAMAVNLRLIEHPPRYDELYHVLAGSSWATDGTLAVGDGEYTRAALFTQLVGLLFRVTGVNLEAARLISAISGALLVAAVFAWTRIRIGRAEAWLAAGLMLLSTVTLTLATMVRFYALHALLFFTGAVAFYGLVEDAARSRASTIFRIALIVALLSACLHLQMTTVIGVSALVLWAGIRTLPALVRKARSTPVVPLSLVALGIVLTVTVFASRMMDLLGDLWAIYRSQALWASGSTPLIYHWWLQNSYPVFYGLLPGLVLLALLRHPRPGLFCIVVFSSGLLVHSFGGMRGEHYVFYLLPFFFIACSIAAKQLLSALGELALRATAAIFPGASTGRGPALIEASMIVVSLLFLIASTPGVYRSFKVIAYGPGSLHAQYTVDWSAARVALSGASALSDVVVTTNSLSALHYLGDYDVEMSPTILHETPSQSEFDRDARTGRPVISSAASLRLLISCYSSGLIVAEKWQWGNDVYGVTEEAIALVQSIATPIDLPSRSNIVAYRWHNPAATATNLCPDLTHSEGSRQTEPQ